MRKIVVFLFLIFASLQIANAKVLYIASGVGHTSTQGGCSGWYAEGDTTSPTADAITTDIRCYPYTTECTGTPTGARAYNQYTALPDDSISIAAYGDSGGSGPDTSNLLFYSAEGDDSGGNPDWSGTLSLTGASNINSGTKIWMCVWDEVSATVYYNAGAEQYYYMSNVPSYPTWPTTGSFTQSANLRRYLIELTYD